MHQLLLPGVEEVDHISGDGLDNRRLNIRAATRQGNAANIGPQRNNASGFKGVVWQPDRGKWAAYSRRRFLGRFVSPIEAALAYDRAARSAFGEFAWLNFP